MKMNCLNSIGTLRGAESTGRQTTGKTTPAGIWPAHLWKALWFSVGGVQVQVLTLYSTNAPPPPHNLGASRGGGGRRPPAALSDGRRWRLGRPLSQWVITPSDRVVLISHRFRSDNISTRAKTENDADSRQVHFTPLRALHATMTCDEPSSDQRGACRPYVHRHTCDTVSASETVLWKHSTKPRVFCAA